MFCPQTYKFSFAETLNYLRDLLKKEYGSKYLRQFVNSHPYRKEKIVSENKVQKSVAKHFSAVPSSRNIRIPEYKKVNNATIGSIFSVSTYADLPNIDDVCAFRVVYGVHKPSKKHKQWTDDGYILIENRNVTIYDETGKM